VGSAAPAFPLGAQGVFVTAAAQALKIALNAKQNDNTIDNRQRNAFSKPYKISHRLLLIPCSLQNFISFASYANPHTPPLQAVVDEQYPTATAVYPVK
jgi:hypothetical protein